MGLFITTMSEERHIHSLLITFLDVTGGEETNTLFQELTTRIATAGLTINSSGVLTLDTSLLLTAPLVLTTPQINDTSSDHQYVFSVSELAADRTVTLPLLTGNDTFVFAAFTQTLTNKTLTSPTLTSPVLTTPQIEDTSSNHQYIIAVSELAADRTVTLPLLTGNDTFTFNAFAATLTNKSIDLGTNTLTGSLSEFNSALQSESFVSLTGSETLSNKTLTSPALTGATGSLASPVLTTPQINDTSSDHQYIVAVSELAADRTLTLPQLAGNDTFVFNDFTATLTNKTLTSPTINAAALSGTLSGTPTFSGDFVCSATPNINAGLQFPASQAADAGLNVLDDYEEGDWSPTITASTNASGQSYDARVGRYVKVGRMVHATAYVRASTLGTLNGIVMIGNLPFTSEDVSNLHSTGSVVWEGLDTAVGSLVTFLLSNSTTMRLLNTQGNQASNENVFAQADLDDGSGFRIAISYRATA